MKLIEANDIMGFHEYMKETGNTICGEQPIRVLMNAINESKLKMRTQFVQYAQSNQVEHINDMSVSYASGISFISLI